MLVAFCDRCRCLLCSNVVKFTIYLKDIKDFEALNEVYEEIVVGESAKPVRTTIQAGKLPKDAAVEIDGVAVI